LGKLFVGSVFVDHPRSARWYEIQLRALDQSTGADSYDHFVVSNGCDKDIFKRSVLVSEHKDRNPEPAIEHVTGLRELCQQFSDCQKVGAKYDGMLILDSDAFPFVEGWRDKLDTWMAADERLPARKWASVVRTENLDTFPHPCVVYVRGDFITANHSPPFWVKSHENLLGFRFQDVTCNLQMRDGVDQLWLPLTRTNVWNPHPVLAAVYGGLFYHHGAGSRWVELRSVTLRQFDHHFPRYNHYQREAELWSEVSMNPLLFARQLSQLQPQ